MNGTRTVKLAELTPNLSCHLCKGYIIDATTIIECLHSFCRSCIVKYLEVDKNEYCPKCDVQLQPSNPLLSVRSDQMLQEIVYKLVPGLFQSEMERRQKFYKDHPNSHPISAEDNGHTNDSYLTSGDTIHLSMELETNDRKLRKRTKRYFKCPAAVTMQILKKLLVAKYDLGDTSCVDILYRGRNLPDEFLLMDISYKYFWRQNGNTPLQLCYRVNTSTSNGPGQKSSHNLRGTSSKISSQNLIQIPSTFNPNLSSSERTKSKPKPKKIKLEKCESTTPTTPTIPIISKKLNGIKHEQESQSPMTIGLEINDSIDRIPVRGRPKKKLTDPNAPPPAKKMKQSKLKKEKLESLITTSQQSTGTGTEVQLRISENGVISATSIESGEQKIIQPKPKSPILQQPNHNHQLTGTGITSINMDIDTDNNNKLNKFLPESLVMMANTNGNPNNKLLHNGNGIYNNNNSMTITPIKLEQTNNTCPLDLKSNSAATTTIIKLPKPELCLSSTPKIPTKRHHHVANGLNGDFKIVKTVSPEGSSPDKRTKPDPTMTISPKPPKFFKSRHNLQGPGNGNSNDSSSSPHRQQKSSSEKATAHNGTISAAPEKQKSNGPAPFKTPVSTPPSKGDTNKSPKHGMTMTNVNGTGEHKPSISNDTLNNYGSLLSHGLVYPGSNAHAGLPPVNLVPFLQSGMGNPTATNPYASGALTNFLTAMAYHSYNQFPQFLSPTAYNNPVQATTYSPPVHNPMVSSNGNGTGSPQSKNQSNGKPKKLEKEPGQKPAAKRSGYIQIIPKGTVTNTKPSSATLETEQKEPLSLKITKGSPPPDNNNKTNGSIPKESRKSSSPNSKLCPNKSSSPPANKIVETLSPKFKQNSSNSTNSISNKNGTDDHSHSHPCHNNNNNNNNNNNVLERSHLDKILERVVSSEVTAKKNPQSVTLNPHVLESTNAESKDSTTKSPEKEKQLNNGKNSNGDSTTIDSDCDTNIKSDSNSSIPKSDNLHRSSTSEEKSESEINSNKKSESDSNIEKEAINSVSISNNTSNCNNDENDQVKVSVCESLVELDITTPTVTVPQSPQPQPPLPQKPQPITSA